MTANVSPNFSIRSARTARSRRAPGMVMMLPEASSLQRVAPAAPVMWGLAQDMRRTGMRGAAFKGPGAMPVGERRPVSDEASNGEA